MTVTDQVLSIPTSAIRPDPTQPRKEFDPEYIEALGCSIVAEGLLQPITVRPDPEKAGAYVIIAGECRWRAHALKGIQAVRCMVSESCDDENRRFRVQTMENMGRKNMTFREEANAIVRMKGMGDDNETIGKSIGLSVYRVENILKLAKLPEGIWRLLDIGAIGRKVAEYAAGKVPECDLERMLISLSGKPTSAAHLIVNRYIDQQVQEDFMLACEAAGVGGKAKDDMLKLLVGQMLFAAKALAALTTEQQYHLGRELSHKVTEEVFPTATMQRATTFLSNIFINVGTEIKDKRDKK